MEIEIRRGADRPASTYDGVVSLHSFSFGSSYDPRNISFAELVAHNADTVQARHGYDTHPHRDTEIVTWVIEGALEHESTAGGGESAVLEPGTAQVLGAGSGVRHAEHAGEATTRFVQLWLPPDEPDLEPRVLREHLAPREGEWAWVPGVRSSRAKVGVARLTGGSALHVPDAEQTHLYVCSGEIRLADGEALAAGDALRVSRPRERTGDGVGDVPRLTGWGEVLLVAASR